MKKLGVLVAVFVVLLLYGGFLRIYNLGSESFWLDESISAVAASKIIEKGAPVFDSGELYGRSYVFHYFMAGFLFLGHEEAYARLVSVLFGVLTSVLVFFIAKEYNKDSAWIAFVLSLFLEVFIVYSRQARMYQMAMFFFFLTLYLLYKGKLWWSVASFLVAYDTHAIAILLIPFFLYHFFYRKMQWWVYLIVAAVVGFLVFRSFSLLYEFRFVAFSAYVNYLRYYAPFILVSLIGIGLSWKHNLTRYLVISLVLIVIAATIGKLFAFRYVYLAFLPVIILASFALSQIKFKYVVLAAYLIWVSNIVSISGAAMLIPSTISHVDFTEPEADFKGMYNELAPFSNSLAVTLTTPAAWYYRNPDYWINFSYTGLNEPWMSSDGKEVYTGALVVNDTALLKGSILVVDDFGYPRIDESIRIFINESCTTLIEKEGVTAYKC